MQSILYIFIIFFGIASYVAGVGQMLQGRYAPSVFSRVVWLLLAAISFAGVIASHSSSASVLLAGVYLAGNVAISVVSFWKGSKDFGRLELFCLVLLAVSGLVWALFDAPLLSLCISLIAHLVGALPTYKRILAKPESESTLFWFFFFAASLLSIFASLGSSMEMIVFPIYFTLFEGSLFVLSLRGRRVDNLQAITAKSKAEREWQNG